MQCLNQQTFHLNKQPNWDFAKMVMQEWKLWKKKPADKGYEEWRRTIHKRRKKREREFLSICRTLVRLESGTATCCVGGRGTWPVEYLRSLISGNSGLGGYYNEAEGSHRWALHFNDTDADRCSASAGWLVFLCFLSVFCIFLPMSGLLTWTLARKSSYWLRW